MSENIDKLRELHKKQIELLDEYERLQKYQSCKYHLFLDKQISTWQHKRYQNPIGIRPYE